MLTVLFFTKFDPDYYFFSICSVYILFFFLIPWKLKKAQKKALYSVNPEKLLRTKQLEHPLEKFLRKKQNWLDVGFSVFINYD